MPRKPAGQQILEASAPPPAPGRLTVSRLIVKGVLGVEDHTIDLDRITLLRGANASGKSSHLQALRAGLGIDRTSLARIAHVGPDGEPGKPEVEVILIGGPGEDREVRVRRRGDGSPEVRERVGEDWRNVPRPVEWLRDLIDVQGANPALWLAMKDEDRTASILESLVLDGYNRKAALDQAGLAEFNLPAIPEGLHPLEELELIEKAVADARAAIGAEHRREQDAAVKLLAGLPAQPPKPVEAEVIERQREADSLSSDVSKAEAAADEYEQGAVHAARLQREASERELEQAFKVVAAELRTAHERKVGELREALQKRINELDAGLETVIDAASDDAKRQIAAAATLCTTNEDEARKTAASMRDQVKSKAEALAAARESLAGLRERQTSIETDRHVRATADEAKTKAAKLQARWQHYDDGLDALKRYKMKLAESLPIQGLAVHFDEKGKKSLTLDGVPLSQVNDGRLAEIATEVSLLRAAGGLPLVLLDGIERLDPARRAALLRAVAARGVQVIAACVGAGALEVLHGEEALA